MIIIIMFYKKCFKPVIINFYSKEKFSLHYKKK